MRCAQHTPADPNLTSEYAYPFPQPLPWLVNFTSVLDMGARDVPTTFCGSQHLAPTFIFVKRISRIVKLWPPAFIREHVGNRT